MKNIFFVFILTLIAGCQNFSPRMQPEINNPGGKIDEISNNQNGIMAEIGKLKQETQLLNSQLKEVQNGLLNLNLALSRNENSGVQILQGDGALIFVYSLAVVGMLLYWYRDRAIKSEKAAELLATEITKLNDPFLNDNVLRSAMKQDCEQHVYRLLTESFQDQEDLS